MSRSWPPISASRAVLSRWILTPLLLLSGPGSTIALADSPPLPAIPFASLQFTDRATALSDWLVVHVPPEHPGLADGVLKQSTDEAVHAALASIEGGTAVAISAEPKVDLGGRFVPVKNPDQKEIFLAACAIDAPSAAPVYALLGNNGSMTLAVNGAVIDSSKHSRSGSAPQYVAKLPLRAGHNILVVRVDGNEPDTGFSVTAIGDETIALHEAVQSAGTCLRSRVVKTAAELELDIRLAGWTRDFECSLVSPDGTTRPLGRHSPRKKLQEPGSVPNGRHTFVLHLGQATYKEPVLIGDPGEIVGALANRAEGGHFGEPVKLEIDSYLHRLASLLATTKRDKNWEYSVVSAIEAADLLMADPSGERRPPVELVAFRSAIDQSVQHYQIAFPNGRAEPVPLLVIVAAVIGSAKPFIDGPTVRSHLEALDIARLAERAGVAVLWPGYRCPPSGSPIDLAHFDQVLSHASSRYPIDPDRVTLVGHCGGGVFAGMMLMRWPERFASLVYYDAMFQRSRVGYRIAAARQKDPYYPFADYRHWLAATDPMQWILDRNFPRPILVLHDGSLAEGHGGVLLSVDFSTRAGRAGVPHEFRKVEPRYGRLGQWQEILQWASQRKVDASSAASAPHFWGGAVADAFTGPFLIVVGTGGTETEQAALAEQARRLGESWRKSQFVDAPAKRDIDVTDQDLRSNLVLIGNAETNVIWKRLAPGLSTDVNSSRIRFGPKEWVGTRLGIHAAERNPLHPEALVVLYGAQQFDGARFDAHDLAVTGWYNFAVWDFDQPEPLIDAGLVPGRSAAVQANNR